MIDLVSKKARYLQDTLPIRLGGLAANLARIGTVSTNPTNRIAVADMLRESKFFIEWTALDFPQEIAVDLIDLQLDLATRHRKWGYEADDENRRDELSKWAKLKSQFIFEHFKELSSQ